MLSESLLQLECHHALDDEIENRISIVEIDGGLDERPRASQNALCLGLGDHVSGVVGHLSPDISQRYCTPGTVVEAVGGELALGPG